MLIARSDKLHTTREENSLPAIRMFHTHYLSKSYTVSVITLFTDEMAENVEDTL